MEINEKKLTDEEIIKILGLVANDKEKDGFTLLAKNALDLIYRLQDEKQKVIQDYYAEKQTCDEQKDIIAKQKTEIERLTKWYDTQSGLYNDLQDENKDLKAEIERLTEEKEDIRLFQLAMQNGEIDMLLESPMAKCFYDCIVQIFEQNGAKNFFTTTVEINGQKGRYAFTIEKTGGVTPAERIAELQKQVDVLTAEKENLYFLNKNLEDYIDNHEPIWERNTEQAVKDTAKEIYQMADEIATGSQNDGANILVAIKKRYGVEVE